MTITDLCWGDEEGNYWGMGHLNKTVFAMRARRDMVEQGGAEEADEEVKDPQASRVFWVWSDINDDDETFHVHSEQEPGDVAITGLRGY